MESMDLDGLVLPLRLESLPLDDLFAQPSLGLEPVDDFSSFWGELDRQSLVSSTNNAPAPDHGNTAWVVRRVGVQLLLVAYGLFVGGMRCAY